MHNSHESTKQTALTPKHIEALHHGVIAIVITLLILELKFLMYTILRICMQNYWPLSLSLFHTSSCL